MNTSNYVSSVISLKNIYLVGAAIIIISSGVGYYSFSQIDSEPTKTVVMNMAIDKNIHFSNSAELRKGEFVKSAPMSF